MKSIIAQYRIDGFWHFTDFANIELIKTHGGLLSYAELQRKGVAIPNPGGNDWSHDADHVKGVHNYVHLAFVDDHPMLYRAKEEGRLQHPIWLKIDISAIDVPGVRYSADVSNKSGIPILNETQAIDAIDFEVLFTRTDWRDPEIQRRLQSSRKSEILIPNIVDISKIIGWKNG